MHSLWSGRARRPLEPRPPAAPPSRRAQRPATQKSLLFFYMLGPIFFSMMIECTWPRGRRALLPLPSLHACTPACTWILRFSLVPAPPFDCGQEPPTASPRSAGAPRPIVETDPAPHPAITRPPSHCLSCARHPALAPQPFHRASPVPTPPPAPKSLILLAPARHSGSARLFAGLASSFLTMSFSRMPTNEIRRV